MRNSENPLHSQSVRPAPFGVCDGLRALPATAWRDLASVIGIRKAGPGAASCLRGCQFPWFLWESRYEACEQHLSAIRSVRACCSFGGGGATQSDSDYSVEDEASPNSFFSQVRRGFCFIWGWDTANNLPAVVLTQQLIRSANILIPRPHDLWACPPVPVCITPKITICRIPQRHPADCQTNNFPRPRHLSR